jgi:hypothetical protein
MVSLKAAEIEKCCFIFLLYTNFLMYEKGKMLLYNEV